MRELRVGSVISAGLSLLVVVVAGLSLVGSSFPGEMKLWIVAIAAGLVLTVTSMLYTATEKKWVGFLHGAMMALTAASVFAYSLYILTDLRKNPRGGFVEMASIPMCGGFIIFSILALGSALQTFLTVTEKRPKPPEPTRSPRGSS